ncbi:MAG: BCCT family transporter [Haliscomenobacter sp.]|nr:BCCT family transporter [Haliscomenobacter sp.]
MGIFSGNALYIDFFSSSADLYGALQTEGPENVVYAVLDQLPLPQLLGITFFLTAFLSYVSGADANTSAMGGLCSTGISPESPEPPAWIKIAWGGIIGITACHGGLCRHRRDQDGLQSGRVSGPFPDPAGFCRVDRTC